MGEKKSKYHHFHTLHDQTHLISNLIGNNLIFMLVYDKYRKMFVKIVIT